MARNEELSSDEIVAISRDITRRLLAKSLPASNPVGILVAGQPASGKTGLMSLIKQRQPALQAGFVDINGDDLRNWHPHYWDLLRRDDKLAADETQSAVNIWVEQLLEAAAKARRNLIIEGTMRKHRVPTKTARLLKSCGYRVGICAMAIPRWQSLLRIFERYETQKQLMGHGRFSSLQVHEQAYKNFPTSLESVLQSKCVDFVEVYGRNQNGLRQIGRYGEDHLALSANDIRKCIQTIRQERERPMTPDEAAEYISVWDDVLDKMRSRYASREEVEQAKSVRDQLLDNLKVDLSARNSKPFRI